ncbi:hypothetical protein [Streptomyces olivochromogenes]|uniref:hypothetical protein n=1 Tax=Streptomyces olivochromogenes TaxID=1963 RepID=UPI001F490447|nr:hypothetical protein [Streptomyces olivochromogenes]MCF3134071.1 hypothetical protein [Streptomyces olivochromogenes]
MLGRTSARPTALSHFRRPAIGGTPAVRGLTAALIAVAALITAANAGPARAVQDRPAAPTAQHATHRW